MSNVQLPDIHGSTSQLLLFSFFQHYPAALNYSRLNNTQTIPSKVWPVQTKLRTPLTPHQTLVKTHGHQKKPGQHHQSICFSCCFIREIKQICWCSMVLSHSQGPWPVVFERFPHGSPMVRVRELQGWTDRQVTAELTLHGLTWGLEHGGLIF